MPGGKDPESEKEDGKGRAEHVSSVSAQIRRAARTGEHARGRDFVAAARAAEPIFTKLALCLRNALALFAFGAEAVHLAVSDIVGKDHRAARALGGLPLADRGAAAGIGADKDG